MDIGKLYLILVIWLVFFLDLTSAISLIGLKYNYNIQFNRRNRTYKIQLNENNVSFFKPVPLFTILEAKNCSDLIINFQKDKGFKYEIRNCTFYATQSFDYEKPDEQSYMFKIISVFFNEKPVSVILNINNVDDEAPSLEITDCYFEENVMYTNRNSPCILKVTDPDGFLQYLDFQISGSRHEEDLFDFTMIPFEIEDTRKEAEVVLSPITELNREEAKSYCFVISATDTGGNTKSVLARILIKERPNITDSIFYKI
ncbi:unnamed protein product [Psylliodes chrysocephalus]|uniref:Cadherin domain-containing protein n=1 Tax=Psylliodes chrysocephalus TaxID=3402493 RepID=A0A9P0DC53_9CUCU|nr:unnamed protein product [Psylliodes chrysocephala]